MDSKFVDFFSKLTSTPSPSGCEEEAQKVFLDFTKPLASEVMTDINGNAIAILRGHGKKEKPLRVMLSAHADEVGLMISHIDEDGYVYARVIGGIDITLLPGLHLDIHHEGRKVRAIVGRKPVHMLQEGDEGKLKIEDIWLDIGAHTKAEALELVSIGDCVTYPVNFEQLNQDIVFSKGVDDKAGVFVEALALSLLTKVKKIYPDVYFVSSVGEEVGAKGAKTSSYAIKPHVAIALDVTFVSDHPGVDKRVYGDVRIGKGPVILMGPVTNRKVVQLLKRTAEEDKIPYQIEIAPTRSGTDADVIHNNWDGIATAVVSIPIRYMHSPNELVSLMDLENTAKLIAGFIRRIDIDFHPEPIV